MVIVIVNDDVLVRKIIKKMWKFGVKKLHLV